MTNTRGFWLTLQMGLLAVYAAALALASTGHAGHLLIRIVLFALAVHLLEVPFAIRALKERQPRMPRLVVSTVLFGILWWIPARRGILAV